VLISVEQKMHEKVRAGKNSHCNGKRFFNCKINVQKNELFYSADAKEEGSGDKRLFCSISTFIQQKPVLATLTMIITILILIVLAMGGYILYLHLHQRKFS